ncbi:AP2 domain-containing protein [Pseudomonas fluorescens]|uniref:hypothetical protein n=1 Tax=Pseudomonas fluorescens TaxID=294 RepID=UPI00190722E1|nr:hypothetical protein [Pseudomonas fluorescens]MBD8091967.1 AP2 domain-containing protein [Pseudomonas fluorescens]MBD8718276.1 AP2 domain-containing protein [Pseudomonas fluorescens]
MQNVSVKRTRNKLVQGFGLNDLDTPTTFKDPFTGKNRPIPVYAAWHSLLTRCYSENYQSKHPTYVGCTVHPDWLSLSKFKEWFDVNYVPGWDLDKDLITHGNKVYGPEFCRYVPPYLNLLITENSAVRGEQPLGVWMTRFNTFSANCRNGGAKKFLGTFPTPMLAHRAWQVAKADAVDDALRRYMAEATPHLAIIRALIRYADSLRADVIEGRESIGFASLG